jgi:LCP family protein required for cell wall assembly
MRGDRRSWPARLLVVVNVGLVVAGLAGVSWGAYVYQRLGNIDRLDIDHVLGIVPGHEDEPAPPPEPGDPENFLLVGSDSRAFVDETGESGSFGSSEDYPDARADTILLVRVDPKTKRAAMLSFPRDLVVDIAGGGRGRLNTAFEGGPEQLIQTVSGAFQVPINHYIQTDFAAFRDLVDAVGGIEVFLPYPVRDWGRPEPGARLRNITGLDVQQTGCVVLDGQQALAYVRSRHFEQFIDGEWTPDLSSDLGRIRRQQDFIVRTVRKALDESLLNPTKVLQLLNLVEGHVDFDIDPLDAVDLGRQFEGIDVRAIEQYQFPVEDIPSRSGFNGLRIADEEEAERILAIFRGEPVPEAEQPVDTGDVTPADVSLTVLNGTGTGGQAAAAKTALEGAGFVVVGTGDSPPYGEETTIVQHPPGEEAAASLVASWLTAGAELVASPSADGITVITGADYDGVRSAVRTTTTTAPGPTSTTSTTLSRQEELERFYAGVGQAECYGDLPS